MKKKNFKKAQSIIEYICVSLVFAAMGIVAFFSVTNASFSKYQTSSVDKILQGSPTNTTTSNP